MLTIHSPRRYYGHRAGGEAEANSPGPSPGHDVCPPAMAWTGRLRLRITRAPSWISPGARPGHPLSDPEVWLRYLNRELAAEIDRLEEELGTLAMARTGSRESLAWHSQGRRREGLPPHTPGVAAWARSFCADVTSWLKEEDGWALHHELTETFSRLHREFDRRPWSLAPR